MRLEVVLAAHAERHPDKVAVICGGVAITYGALQHSIRQVAGGLGELGLGRDDKIMLYLPNGVAVVQLLYAALALGAVAVPVTTRMTMRELADFCEDCEAKVLAFHVDQADALSDLLAARQGMASVVVGGEMPGAVPFRSLLQDRAGDLPAVPGGQDECMINYTSGTTGRAKGAIITHANVLIQNGFIHPVEWGLSAEDCFLVVTPLTHRTGMGRLANALTLGATIVVMESFDAAMAVDLIEGHGVTVMGMVPTVCRMMLPEIAIDPGRCRSLRRVLVTGEAFPVSLKEQFIELLPDTKLVSFFAMTEAGRHLVIPRGAIYPSRLCRAADAGDRGQGGERCRRRSGHRRGRRITGALGPAGRLHGDEGLFEPSRGNRRRRAGRLVIYRRSGLSGWRGLSLYRGSKERHDPLGRLQYLFQGS